MVEIVEIMMKDLGKKIKVRINIATWSPPSKAPKPQAPPSPHYVKVVQVHVYFGPVCRLYDNTH